MLWVPQKGRVRVETNVGTVGDITPGTVITTGTPASTKGSVVELIAATAFDAYMVEISATHYALAATDSRLCVDLLIGTSTEEVLIADLLFGQNYHIGGRSYIFPLYIPAGSRLAAKAAGDRVSTAFQLSISLSGGNGVPPWRVGSKVVTYGISTVPAGTTVVPGASAAEGSWTQISASSTEDHFALHCGWQGGLDTTKLARGYQVDIGLGAATEEEIGSWLFEADASELLNGPWPAMPAFVDVPSGTRLAMRASNDGTNDSGNYNGVIYGVS